MPSVEPYPCGKSTHICPFTIRCMKIDDAALITHDPDVFARMAIADEQLSEDMPAVFKDKPGRRFLEAGGCEFFRAHYNGGSRSSLVCALVDVQLHNYVEVKFCEAGRKVYCPIYKARTDGGV